MSKPQLIKWGNEFLIKYLRSKIHLFKIATVFSTVFLAFQYDIVFAQYYSVLEQGPYTTAYNSPTSVSNWGMYPNEYSIAIVPSELSQCIRLVMHNNFYAHLTNAYGGVNEMKEINIPNGMYIEDVETVGQYAVFCGRIITNMPYRGFIGYFDINDFFSTPVATVSLHIHIIDSVTNIKQVAVCEQAGNIHVAAIGEKLVDNHTSYYIVEHNNLTSVFSGIVFNIAKLSDNSTIREYASEIKVTQNYFVVLGFDSQSDALSFRRFSNVTGLGDTERNKIYYLNTSDIISRTHSAHILGNIIGVSYLSGTGTYYTKIRYINIQSKTNNVTQKILINEKLEPVDLIFMPNNNHMVLLQNYKKNSSTAPTQSVFINIPLVSGSFYATYYNYSRKNFYTLDNIDYTGNCIIALGNYDYYAIKDMDAPWTPNVLNCPVKDSVLVSTNSNSTILNKSVPITIQYYLSHYSQYIYTAQNKKFRNSCIND